MYRMDRRHIYSFSISLLKARWFTRHNDKYLHNTYFWINIEIDLSKVMRWNVIGTNCVGRKVRDEMSCAVMNGHPEVSSEFKKHW